MEAPTTPRILELWLRQPRWVHTGLAAVVVLVLIGLAVMIAVPALIIGACVVGFVLIAAAARSLLVRLRHGPRGDTMRKNVRVVVRREP